MLLPRPKSPGVPLFSGHSHCPRWLGWGTGLRPLPRHCCRGEGTGGRTEGTAAVPSAAAPSIDETPSSSLCQPRPGKQQRHNYISINYNGFAMAVSYTLFRA